MITLASTANYAIRASHDYVYLGTPEGEHLLGWMYGNAHAALFDVRERWVVIMGCGLWIVRLPLPPGLDVDRVPGTGAPATLAGTHGISATEPFVQLLADPSDMMWLETVYDTGLEEDVVRVVADRSDQYAGVYDVNVMTFEVTKRL